MSLYLFVFLHSAYHLNNNFESLSNTQTFPFSLMQFFKLSWKSVCVCVCVCVWLYVPDLTMLESASHF